MVAKSNNTHNSFYYIFQCMVKGYTSPAHRPGHLFTQIANTQKWHSSEDGQPTLLPNGKGTSVISGMYQLLAVQNASQPY